MKFFILFFLTPLLAFSQYSLLPSPVDGNISLNSGIQYVYITNTSGSPKTLNLSISQSGVNLQVNRCTSVLGNNKNCYIVINVDSNLIPEGNSIFPLNSGGSPIVNLKTYKAPSVQSSEFTPSTITVNDFNLQEVVIRNKTGSSKTYSPTLIGVNADKYEILINRCLSPVSSNGTCRISFKLKPQQAGTYTAQISDSQVVIPLTINSQITQSTVGVLNPQTSSISVSPLSLNFGTLTRYGASSPLTITITNTGTTVVNPIFEFSSKSKMALSRCSSIVAGATCSISVSLNPDSNTPNGNIIGENVIIKKNALDSGTVVNFSGILNVGNVCLTNEHLESGVCVSNSRNCSVSNGSGTQLWSSGSWGTCNVSSCNSGYYQHSNSCALITYTGLFSNYSPAVPSVLTTCLGTVISSRTVISCMRDDNFALVANSNCIDLSSSITTKSPSGNINLSISNGNETYACAEGSDVQTFVSRTCDSGYYNSGTECSMITYVASYSIYTPTIPTSLSACDGEVNSTRTISQCQQQHDNQIVSNSFCSDSLPSVITQSPAGTININIPNGTETRSCSLGQTLANSVLISRNCDIGSFDDGLSCQSFLPLITAGSLNLSLGSTHACSIKTGIGYCWGNNESGQIGTGGAIGNKQLSPVSINMNGSLSGKTLKYISSGYNHTCAIASDDNVYCWGGNSQGQLGRGTFSADGTGVNPEPIITSGVLAGRKAKMIVSSANATCMVSMDNNAYCWGSNSQGQLGNGSATSSNVPVAVNTAGVLSGKTIKSLSAWSGNACVIASDNNAYCWGYNSLGRLGNGNTVNSSVPVAVSTSGALAGKTIKSISVAGDYSCVIASDDNAYCWGSNGFAAGLLGSGQTISHSTTPVAVSKAGYLSGKTVKAISSGRGGGSCVIASDDKVYCWGTNNIGQLGNGTTTGSTTPTPVGGLVAASTFRYIITGGSSACSYSLDDKVYCWGQNLYGELGIGTSSSPSLTPVQVNPF